jgi:antitoxin (DNA-binding transcriptional repressor) of toxin-antitoxin stability system
MARYRISSKKSRDAPVNAIAATEAAKTFGRLVNRVSETRATYVIERGGTPVAKIGPIDAKESTASAVMDALRAARSAFDEAYVASVKRGVRRGNKPDVPKNPWAR